MAGRGAAVEAGALLVEQGLGDPHEDAGRAEPALERAGGGEGGGQLVPALGRHALERGDRRALDPGQRQVWQLTTRLAVDAAPCSTRTGPTASSRPSGEVTSSSSRSAASRWGCRSSTVTSAAVQREGRAHVRTASTARLDGSVNDGASHRGCAVRVRARDRGRGPRDPRQPGRRARPAGRRTDRPARDFHRRLPGYAATAAWSPRPASPPSSAWPSSGSRSSRAASGCPRSRCSGASWATYRLLVERLGAEPAWAIVEELRGRAGAARAALAGRRHRRQPRPGGRPHGPAARATAPTSSCRPGTAAARIDGIASEGAEVTVVDGTYDDAVAASAPRSPATTCWSSPTRRGRATRRCRRG